MADHVEGESAAADSSAGWRDRLQLLLAAAACVAAIGAYVAVAELIRPHLPVGAGPALRRIGRVAHWALVAVPPLLAAAERRDAARRGSRALAAGRLAVAALLAAAAAGAIGLWADGGAWTAAGVVLLAAGLLAARRARAAEGRLLPNEALQLQARGASW